MTVLNNYRVRERKSFFHKFSFLVFSLFFLAATNLFGQLSITSTGTPFTIDFDNTVSGVNNGQFTGSGFSPTPSSGQINSNAFSIPSPSLSDGNLLFGGTQTTSPTDFTRGISTGGVTIGGIYAFTVASGNRTLGFQSSDADMTSGYIILKLTNNTGGPVSAIKIEYGIWELNNSTSTRSTSLNFSYSPDNSTYTSVSSLNFSTGGPADFPPLWKSPSSTHLKIYTIDLSGSELNNGSDFYIRWATDDFSGAGDRDEIGIDNITVTLNPGANDNDSDVVVYPLYQVPSGTISSLSNDVSTSTSVFYFQISDQGTSDGVPTYIQTMRFVPNTANESWLSQIQGVVIRDGVTTYTQQSVDITDSYIDVTFAEGILTVNDGVDLPLRLEIFLNTTGIIDGGNLDFKISGTSHGFVAYNSGSTFASSFPADVTSNQFTIDVEATELRFFNQPINANTFSAMATDVSVEATDVNGNKDLDFTNSVDLSSDGTMTGDPISVAAIAGVVTWVQSTDPIVHTLGGTGLTLTASSGSLTDGNSNSFDIIQTADRVDFTSYSLYGQRNQVVEPIVVSALKPDLTVDDTYTGIITLSVNTGPGNITGTLVKTAVNGVAAFSDIRFNTNGSYTLLATGAPYMTTGISGAIEIVPFFQGFFSCPPADWNSVLISGNSWTCATDYASVNGLGGSSPTEAWYISPLIDFSSLSSQVLSFISWTGGTDDSHPRLEVVYSTNYSGSGNPNIASWSSLVYSPPAENSQVWVPSGTIDLSGITVPAYVAFKYTSSGTTAGAATEWRIDNVAITENGCSAPTIQASNLTFSDIQSTQMTLNWNNGDGTGRLVIANASTSPPEIPVDGTNYTANAAYSTPGTEIGSSFVVYKGNLNSVTVTNLAGNPIYYFAVYEYNNCNVANPTFNTTSPVTGSQSTNTSDIIAQSGYMYSILTDYITYDVSSGLILGNSRDVFGLSVQDGGTGNPTDGFSTTLTSITFNINGSNAIRAAALFDDTGTNIGEILVDGSNEFTLSGINYIVPDGTSRNMELRVTFEDGVLDNEQIVFTVTEAIADPSGTVFGNPDAGGAESSRSGNHNRIDVIASQLNFVQVPTSVIPVNENFTIEVEAVDSRGSQDLDKFMYISKNSGTGNLISLSTGTDLLRTTTSGTYLWDDLNYDTEESGIRFYIDDGEFFLDIYTDYLTSRYTFGTFTFTGASGAEVTFRPDNQPTNVTISDISRGSGIQPNTLADAFNGNGWPASGLDANSYYEITVTANTGYNFNLTGIMLDHRKSATGPGDWEVRTSLNNYGSNIGGFFTTSGDAVWNQETYVDFSTSIQNQTSVTLRIYAYNAGGALGTWAVDNIRIFGQATDIQAPSFTAGYPQYDSVAVNGFDLLVNIDEPASVYYIAQDINTAAPSEAQVIDGLDGTGIAAEASGSFAVTTADSTYWQRINTLGLLNLYDVYFVLDDGTNQSLAIALEDIPLSDSDTELASAAAQPGGSTISSVFDTPAEAVAIFNFNISDLGTADGAPTHVTKLAFDAGVNNTVADWSTVIGGASLYNVTQAASIVTTGVTINTTSLEIDLVPGALTIADGSTDEIALSIWLTNSVVDNEALELTLGGAGHTNQTYEIGSQFNPTLTSLTSNTFTIDVDADRLNIIFHTPDIPNNNQSIELQVESTDINGNRDLDEISDVTVVLGQNINGGSLSVQGSPPLTQALNSGYIAWTNIRYSQNNDFITLITSCASLADDTTGIIEIGNPGDLIVTTNLTLSTDLTVNRVFIEPTGNLTINAGITLSVSGDTLNIDGILNGQSGTINFIGGGNSLQKITGSVAAANFYNITVTNRGNQGIRAELNINLRNTLLLLDGAIFDADGSGDDKNFTLVSTPTYTARIGPMGIDAELRGNITWQRSLRTGPQGWRYVGTPIKGQTVANWRDDVRIQGIAEFGPNLNTNFAQYSEPLGTTGQNGYDGWVKYNSDSDPIPVGVGNKLWEWSQLYKPTLTIINTGLPTIGNGGDNIAGAGESIVFPVSFTSSSLDGGGWNFYANPYPCELNWNSPGFTHTGIDGNAVYIWNPSTQQYGTFDGSESINGVTQYIASGQGFFIKATSGGAAISVTENAKSTADGNSFLRIAEEPYASLKLKIESDNRWMDETVVAFKSYATDGHDPELDARKLAGGWVNLSSKLDNGLLMAINSMGSPRGVKRVKLNIDPYYYGNYSLTFPKIKDFDEGTIIYLRDNFLNKTMVINDASTYNFQIVENNLATFGDNRFELQMLLPVKFSINQVQAKAGQEFVIPVYADQLADITSTQMVLGWDTEALSFVGIEDTGDGDMSNFNLSDVENGRLSFNEMTESPIDLPDGTQLFSIRFKALNGHSEAMLQFINEVMNVKAISDIAMPFTTKDALITILQNRFIAGKVATYTGTPVNGVSVNAEGDDLIEKLTDVAGAYSLDAFEQSNYTVSASKFDDAKMNTGVTTLDIIQTRRHLLQIDELTSPYQIVAADVNLSKSITALDLAQMRKVVLGMDEGFNDGLNWLFIPETYDLAIDPFSYETSLDISLVDQDLNLDFVAVKIGDVNNSWTGQSSGRQSNASIELSMENLKLENEIVEIPIFVRDFREISGYQFSITWDPTQLEYYSIGDKTLEGFYNEQFVNEGVLTTMWDEYNGKSIDLEDGVILFTLKFAVKDENASSLVELSSRITEAIAFDSKLNALAINATSARVELDELRNGKLELFQNVPNPFDYSTQIEFKIPNKGKVSLSVINLLGEIVYLHEEDYNPGIYSLTWDRSKGNQTITPGVYLYKLESNGETVIKKMLVK